MTAFTDLAATLAHTGSLRSISALLGWDQETYMPPKATPATGGGTPAKAPGGSLAAAPAASGVGHTGDLDMPDAVEAIRKELEEAGWPLPEGASDEVVRAAGQKLERYLAWKRQRSSA